MGWAVSIGDFDRSYTFNVAPMYSKVDLDIRSLDGLKGKYVSPVLQMAISRFIENYRKMVKLNPRNNWGDALGALLFLIRIFSACKRWPNAKIRIT